MSPADAESRSAREPLAIGVTAQRDDALGAEALGGQGAREADGAVADNGNRAARAHVGAHRSVVTGRHHVRQRQQRGEHLLRVARAGHGDERAVGERHADGLALAAIELGAAPPSAVQTGRLQSLLTELAGAI